MKCDIKIERMTPETVAEVSRLELQCFSIPWSLQALTAELENPLAVFYTARLRGRIAGYAGMHSVVGEGYITNVAVLPEYRRRGIASTLVECLLEYGVRNGLAFISLEVRKSNEAAKSLYNGLGFKVAGSRKSFYSNPIEDAVIMTRYFEEKFV